MSRREDVVTEVSEVMIEPGVRVERRARRRGFVVGALFSLGLGLVACATGGSGSRGPDGATPPEAGRGATAPVEGAPATSEAAPATSEAAPASEPAAAPAPAGESTTAPPSADAAAAGPGAEAEAAASPAGATSESPVAGYLADPQAMVRASQLFRAVCTGYCHSSQPTTAERVAPNLFDCAWDHGSTDEAIFQSIAVGIPDTQMQGFGERLPKEDLWKLVAFVRQRSTCN